MYILFGYMDPLGSWFLRSAFSLRLMQAALGFCVLRFRVCRVLGVLGFF